MAVICRKVQNVAFLFGALRANTPSFVSFTAKMQKIKCILKFTTGSLSFGLKIVEFLDN